MKSQKNSLTPKQKKGGKTMHKLNWTISIPQYDKLTNQMYYKQIDLQYKQEAILQNIAYIIASNHNQPIYDKKVKGKYWTTKQVISKYNTYPVKEKQRVIDTYIEQAYQNYIHYIATKKEEQELEHAKKLVIREKQLTQYQEQVDNYFKEIELKHQASIAKFIQYVKGTPEQKQLALNWFNQLSYNQQEYIINSVDNYQLKDTEEILVGNQEILEKGAL